jgi:cytochrome c-type biogenesis protein CcmE
MSALLADRECLPSWRIENVYAAGALRGARVSTGCKLAIGGALIAGATAYMAYLGVSASWQYYLTVDECTASASSLPGQRIRVSGKVSPGTLRIASDRREADFSLQGTSAKLRVVCSGALPGNLAENIDVVVEGRLDDAGTLHGDKLLTRCASKYVAKTPTAASGTPPPATGRGDS